MRWVGILTVVALAGCESGISAEISQQAAASPERLDLAKVGGTDWERICFLGPYTHNEMAEKALGFYRNVEARTDIASSDGINVLVFVKGKQVVAYTEHPRHQDFWRLSGQCFPRENAVFVKGKDGYVHGN